MAVRPGEPVTCASREVHDVTIHAFGRPCAGLGFSGAHAGDGAPRPLRIALTLRHGLPTTQAMIGGKSVTLELNAGSYQVVGLKTAVLGRVPVCFTGDRESFADADGHVFTSRIFHAQPLAAGGLDRK